MKKKKKNIKRQDKEYTLSYFQGKPWGRRDQDIIFPPLKISARALESPTSQPRINKGDLWQGRERKKRGKETSDPSPARKYHQDTLGTEQSCPPTPAESELRLFPLQRTEGPTRLLPPGRLCTWIGISNPQSSVSRPLREQVTSDPQHSTVIPNVNY